MSSRDQGGGVTGLALSIALAALGACGGVSSRGPGVESRAPDPAAVIGWALGADRRAPRPPTGEAYLLLASVGQRPSAGTRVTPGCVESASFLPAPAGDPRIFFVVRGSLSVRLAPGQAPEPLKGGDPALTIAHLLAWNAAASPLEVLVEARPHGAKAAEIWVVAIEDRTIVRQGRAPAGKAFADRGSFFRTYSSPRCLSGESRCLVLTVDGRESYVEVEPTRGKPPEPLADLGKLNVHDVAWAAKDGSSLYLLADCPL